MAYVIYTGQRSEAQIERVHSIGHATPVATLRTPQQDVEWIVVYGYAAEYKARDSWFCLAEDGHVMAHWHRMGSV